MRKGETVENQGQIPSASKEEHTDLVKEEISQLKRFKQPCLDLCLMESLWATAPREPPRVSQVVKRLRKKINHLWALRAVLF